MHTSNYCRPSGGRSCSHHANDQQNQQYHRPTTKLIAHHHPIKNQELAPEGPVNQYVQGQRHHQNR